MKKFNSILAFAIIASLTGACKKDQQTCPDTVNGVLNWTKVPNSFSTWQIENEGGNGSGRDGKINLQKSCGWTPYGAPLNADGLNQISTYCIQSPDENVIFTWAYLGLFEIDINETWQGTTAEGIRMGDQLSKFIQTYPEFHVASPGTQISTYLLPSGYPWVTTDSTIWAYDGSDNSVLAQFSSSSPKGKLIRLTVIH